MMFEIQWTGHQGAAVDLAEGGNTYTPAEFARLYRDGKR
jgi:hypothetical protein